MSQTRILTFGRTGQVAQALAAAAPSWPEIDMVCLGRPDVDLADTNSLRQAVARHRPHLILNAAAYTQVDRAETEPGEAMRLNRDAPGQLAAIAEEAGCALMHLSTDCVFDGLLDRPYRPDDTTHALGVYGRSKLAGEEAVRAALERHLVVRVSWIFSTYGSNFVTKMLELAGKRDTLSVVSDQTGCPTYAPDLANGLIRMALAALAPDFRAWGTYHLAGVDCIDRYQMAAAIVEESLRAGGPGADIKPILTRDYGAAAERPLNARLDSSHTEKVFGVRIEAWQENMKRCVRQLVTGEAQT